MEEELYVGGLPLAKSSLYELDVCHFREGRNLEKDSGNEPITSKKAPMTTEVIATSTNKSLNP